MFTLLLACVEDTPAPPTLDEFMHLAWQHYAAEDFTAMAEATVAVSSTFDPGEFPLQGTFSDLSEEEAGLVDVEWDADPSKATGFYVVDVLDCSDSELEKALTNLHQEEVYPENYTAYERTYTTDDEAYFSGESPILYWDTTYSVTIPIFGGYTTSIHGGLQRIEGEWDTPAYATRTWAPNPADCEKEEMHFEQDYQIEVFYPSSGGVVHVYGMWRQFGVTQDSDQDDPVITSTILDAMHDYFDNTSTYCASLR